MNVILGLLSLMRDSDINTKKRMVAKLKKKSNLTRIDVRRKIEEKRIKNYKVYDFVTIITL